MNNSGKYKFKIEILEQQETDKINDLGENFLEFRPIKTLFANIESRVGSLLNGRPADTVMTSVTHKLTWRFKSFSEILPNKHRIRYNNRLFEVNYSVNIDSVEKELEVFVTEVI